MYWWKENLRLGSLREAWWKDITGNIYFYRWRTWKGGSCLDVLWSLNKLLISQWGVPIQTAQAGSYLARINTHVLLKHRLDFLLTKISTTWRICCYSWVPCHRIFFCMLALLPQVNMEPTSQTLLWEGWRGRLRMEMRRYYLGQNASLMLSRTVSSLCDLRCVSMVGNIDGMQIGRTGVWSASNLADIYYNMTDERKTHNQKSKERTRILNIDPGIK